MLFKIMLAVIHVGNDTADAKRKNGNPMIINKVVSNVLQNGFFFATEMTEILLFFLFWQNALALSKSSLALSGCFSLKSRILAMNALFLSRLSFGD